MNWKFTFLIISFVFTKFVFTQVVTTDPNFPIPEAGVTVFFDATKGNLELMDYSGDIYAHTGVITTNSTSGGDWKYVIAEWDENIPDAKLTKISSNYYSLNISPSIIDFYEVPETETILKLAFVFRNEDGSLVGRGDDGEDIFITVYHDATGIIISSPDSTDIYSPSEIVTLNAVSLFANHMELFINDTLVETTNSNEITYDYVATVKGINKVRITATDGTDSVEDSTYFFVRGETQIAELPSADLMDGINYIDSTTVTLVLHAPDKEFVFIHGSFNDWQLTLENQLYKTPDGSKFWVTLDNLIPRKEYIYQYNIDGEIIIADPYTEKILDPWNDQYISNETYPNLIPYPTAEISDIASIFQTDQESYEWEENNFKKPAKEDLVIYELLIRDFVAQHNYNTLIDTLDYLDSLGINAIELMPVSEFEGNSSWGYNPSFYFAPDKYYGTKNALKHFIDECHKRGIAVIMDIVLNHSYGQSPLVQMYFSNGNPSPSNPWYNVQSPNTAFSWGYDFNHESDETKRFVSRVVKFWLEEYRFDGYRFDFTKGFTNTPGDGSGFDASRISILRDIADTIWSVEPEAYVILEHFADDLEEKVLTNYGMMVWGNQNHNYCQSSMGYSSESDFSRIFYKNRSFSYPHLVGYMESHDEERQLYKNITWGNVSGSYDIKDLKIALQRAELTSLFFFTVPGPKMIWQFEELGYDYSIDYDCRVCEKPIKWDYFQEESRNRLYHLFKEMINLKKSHDVFKAPNIDMDVNGETKQIVIQGEEMDVLIMGNFGVESKLITPNYKGTETLYEYFRGDTLSNFDTPLLLHAGEYRLFTSKKLASPNIPAFPEIFNINVSGNLNIGSTLQGSYTYFDINGDTEGQSTYKWYIADDTLGTNATEIENSNYQTHSLSGTEAGKYLAFEVIPVANTTSYQVGTPRRSIYIGPIANSTREPLIFPNPIDKEYFNIINIADVNKIEIYNHYGQIVNEYIPQSENGYQINIPQLRTGIYFVKITGADYSKTIKIIKK